MGAVGPNQSRLTSHLQPVRRTTTPRIDTANASLTNVDLVDERRHPVRLRRVLDTGTGGDRLVVGRVLDGDVDLPPAVERDIPSERRTCKEDKGGSHRVKRR